MATCLFCLLLTRILFSLSAWSLATGSLPQSSVFPHLPVKPGIIADIEASLWVPYTDDGKSHIQTSYSSFPFC